MKCSGRGMVNLLVGPTNLWYGRNNVGDKTLETQHRSEKPWPDILHAFFSPVCELVLLKLANAHGHASHKTIITLRLPSNIALEPISRTSSYFLRKASEAKVKGKCKPNRARECMAFEMYYDACISESAKIEPGSHAPKRSAES